MLPFHFGAIMCLLAIKFPICVRKIILTMRKIAAITFLDTGCLMSIFYCFLFGQMSKNLVGGEGRAKVFDWGTAPMPTGFVVAQPELKCTVLFASGFVSELSWDCYNKCKTKFLDFS